MTGSRRGKSRHSLPLRVTSALSYLAAIFLMGLMVSCHNVDVERQDQNRVLAADGKARMTSQAALTGLNFPSNGQASGDIEFRFTGTALPPIYPATYIWRVNLRQQAGYYTTFYWGPSPNFTGTAYYGAHPYPDGEPKTSSLAHKWNLSLDGKNQVTDANGHSTQLGYGAWRIQALRVYDNGTNKVHEFFWDLPDTTKVIRTLMHRSYGSPQPSSAALTFGGSPWDVGQERLSGLLRGLQLYSARLSPADILAEIGSPLSTMAGNAGIWYLNLNPTPTDIADKSGKGHHPAWVGSVRPALWTETGNLPPTVTLVANPASVASGGSSTLTWSTTDATGCTASGAWSGARSTSGSASTGSLTATSTFTLACTGPGGTASRSATVTVTNTPPAPTVALAANPASVASGGSSTLTWSTTDATGCTASGAWSGSRATSGSASTGSLTATSTFTLVCTGPGGTASRSATVTVTNTPPAPTVALAANPASVTSGGSSTLTWSTTDATSCTASGAWSGSRATSGSASTGSLTSASTFTLACTGPGGSASQSTTVTITPPTGTRTGLNFPSNGQTSDDIKFQFKGSSLQPMYPATYIWSVNLRQQAGYYTTFFWSIPGTFQGKGFYGCHPYPDGEPKPSSRSHKWELSIDGQDFVADANGHSTQLGYDVWRTQAFRAYDNGTNKVHEFFWDLPDTTKVIRVLLDRSYGTPVESNSSLTFGDAPWGIIGEERLSGILRGIQTYSARLTLTEVLAEMRAPMSSAAGGANIWYLNVNPTPSDISDKSGKGHHPVWSSSARPTLWTSP